MQSRKTVSKRDEKKNCTINFTLIIGYEQGQYSPLVHVYTTQVNSSLRAL